MIFDSRFLEIKFPNISEFYTIIWVKTMSIDLPINTPRFSLRSMSGESFSKAWSRLESYLIDVFSVNSDLQVGTFQSQYQY